jgi:hypothetical protein
MKKMDYYNAICKRNKEASFVANVIMNWHRNPATKLKGLYNLLNAGHKVRFPEFSINSLVIDGVSASWIVLDEWANRKR